MPTQSSSFRIHTKGFNDIHDITGQVRASLAASKVTEGVAVVFIPGSTAGITTIEFEHGAINDLRKAIDRLAPEGDHYDHDARWGDGNGFAHVRAALLGPSLAIPVSHGALQLGTWQQIVMIDFDNRPRDREIVVRIMGD